MTFSVIWMNYSDPSVPNMSELRFTVRFETRRDDDVG